MTQTQIVPSSAPAARAGAPVGSPTVNHHAPNNHEVNAESAAPARQRRRATLQDLADSLRLSTNTVSRALAGKDGVAERTRLAVMQEAERIGYGTPSRLPRTESKMIALIVTSSTNVFTSYVIRGVEAALRHLGYTITIHFTEESPVNERSAIDLVLAGDYAGVIAIPVQDSDDDPWDRPGGFPFPVVAVAREITSFETDFVAMDARAAMFAATRHLLTVGAQRIVFFDEDLTIWTNKQRAEGYLAALASEPHATHEVVTIPTRRFEDRVVPWQPEEAYHAVSRLLDDGLNCDAMVFQNDYFALGAIRALRDHGLSVPDDVLVMGYGDHPFSQFIYPSLSTVSTPSQVIAEAAVTMLLQRIAGDQSPPIQRLVSGELVIRESSARPFGKRPRT